MKIKVHLSGEIGGEMYRTPQLVVEVSDNESIAGALQGVGGQLLYNAGTYLDNIKAARAKLKASTQGTARVVEMPTYVETTDGTWIPNPALEEHKR